MQPADTYSGKSSASSTTWSRSLHPMILLGVLALAQLGIALWVTTGPFSIDDVIYRLMAESTAAGNSVFVDTGFEEFGSQELLPRFVDAATSGSAAQYPNGHAYLAAFFLPVLGASAFPFLNSVAFIGCLAMSYSIARRTMQNDRLALLATGLFGFGTFAWEYSVGVWPHMLTLALGLIAFRLALSSLDQSGSSRLYALAAGFIAGIAVTVRLDAALYIGIIGLFLLWDAPRDWKSLSSFGLGILPGLFMLAWWNYLKWNSWVPFTYGSGSGLTIERYLLLAAVLVVIVLVVVWFRVTPTGSRKPVWAALSLLGLGALVFAPTRRVIADTVTGLWILVLDIRPLDEFGRPGLLRTEGGGVVYVGSLKKAALQSAPFLAATPSAFLLGRSEQSSKLGYLALPVIAFPLFYAPWAWHGGQSFNMRYLIPVLPFACILAVASLKAVIEVRPVLDKAGKDLLLRAALGTLALYLLLFALDTGYRETTYLTVPLLLVVVISLAATLFKLRPTVWAGRAFLAAVAAGIIWGGAVAFSYDVPRSIAIKTSNESTAESVAALIEDSSLLFVEWPDNLYGVRWLKDDVLVALPHQDDFADSARLMRLNLSQGRFIYGALTPESWRRLPDVGGSWREVASIGRYVVKRYQA